MSVRRVLLAILVLAAAAAGARADVRAARDLSRFEGRTIESVEVAVEEASVEESALAELRSRVRIARGQRFSAVLVRESLQALFDTGRVANARVEAADAAGPAGEDGRPRVAVRFIIKPQVVVAAIEFEVGVTEGTGITEDELRGRVNLLDPGKRLTEQALKESADAIQIYMRDRGFYRATVDYEQSLDATRTRSTVTFLVEPGPPTLLERLDVQIAGFNPAPVIAELPLQPGRRFTQAALGETVSQLRQAIISEGRLAPRIEEPEIRLDSATNRISVRVAGTVGPRVAVRIEGYELSEKRQRELLPVRREGTIETSAIFEGARRLRNRLQEEGYFFAEVTASCSVVPPLAPPPPTNLPPLPGAPEAGLGLGACEALNLDELNERNVTIAYNVERGRRFKLTDVRIEGTEKLAIADVEDDLRTREANILGILPLLGYGRGYTSEDALDRDRATIEARMRDLGHRRAAVNVRRGVSLEGENLIITFEVTEGPLTRVAGVETRGNQIYTGAQLRGARCPADPLPDEACVVDGGPYSRSQARADAERMRAHYVRSGYVESEVRLSVVDLPPAPGSTDERVRLVYDVTESDKFFINRIFINGLVQTDRQAVLDAIPLREQEVLRGDELAESERILLNTTDAFRQVLIRTEDAGETEGGFKRRDVIIDLEERKRITTDYIVGFSTDTGPLGGFELRNTNLFGKLRQGAIRSRFSRLQQLVRFEYFDPTFRRYGEREFAPLTASIQYQRDTAVTRFFRSTIDRGSDGIVQRFDPEGNLIDEFGQGVKGPSINRLTFNIETQRDLELDLSASGAVRKRSTIFLRYNYEDVRLFNIGSLLIAPVLRPDQTVRLSRFGASFARDTRDRQFDPTRGEFVSVDYAIALKQLGGNISFNKLLVGYRRYKLLPAFRNTVLAASAQFGLAKIFSPTDRNDNGRIDDADLRLPISERFFTGGSTTLRGFSYEEAGPRVVAPFCTFGPVPGGAAPDSPFGPLPPCGTFRNEKGEPVTLNPFTVPIGGNAMAILNLEARVPITRDIQAVPFYDGGNVFERVGDLFGRASDPGRDPNLRQKWTHTVGLGLRLKTPIGSLGVDYGYLLNPPEFLIPQFGGGTAVHRLRNAQIHFRFGQTF
ncbi:MAG TPA: POTRA domain-containing protein [Pyrinomonadaceae bacterium]|nr:POTRA domain-containing protein [Pyrinomonadaceae bacterium]